MFEEYGKVVEVALIKDKVTGLQRGANLQYSSLIFIRWVIYFDFRPVFAGCCFVKYSSLEEAERAISGLNNVRTLSGVRFIFNAVDMKLENT